jgi:nucleotidyltransferase substrate binding protein (TIGR01987 family)
MRKTKALFACEHSAHYYYRENYRADSGIITSLIVAEIVSKENKPLSELLDEFRKYHTIEETSVEVKNKDAKLKEIESIYSRQNPKKILKLDGITIEFNDFWFNVRPSNTEPLLRLNLEANSRELMTLDLSSLKKAVNSLDSAVEIASSDKEIKALNKAQRNLIRAGVIQHFEFTYELCWKFMQRWLEKNLGSAYIDGIPRKELFRIAAENKLIGDVKRWLDYHEARNKTAHTYAENVAKEVFKAAKLFQKDAGDFLKRLEEKNV